MSDREAALFSNEAFYRAFAERDMTAMEEVWARNLPVICIHPGWSELSGREHVLQSWRAILENPATKTVVCRRAQVYLYGDMAVVTCYEILGEALLIASNIFVQEDGLWKLVHHQAGPTNMPLPDDADEDEDITVH